MRVAPGSKARGSAPHALKRGPRQGEPPWTGLPKEGKARLARPLLLLAGLLAAGLALRQLPGLPPQVLLGRWVAGHGPLGALAFVAGGGALCALGLPRQALAYAGGLALGAWTGGALSLLAMLLGCTLDFAWARAVARDWARRRLRGRWATLDAFLATNPFTATLTLRLLPVGSNVLLNLLAGVSGIAFPPFLAATALGYLPQTAVFALLGAGTRVDRGPQLWLGLALFAASAALGLALLRRQARPPPEPARDREPPVPE